MHTRVLWAATERLQGLMGLNVNIGQRIFTPSLSNYTIHSGLYKQVDPTKRLQTHTHPALD